MQCTLFLHSHLIVVVVFFLFFYSFFFFLVYSLRKRRRATALDNLDLLTGDRHAPEPLGKLVAVPDLAGFGLNRCVDSRSSLVGSERAMLLGSLAVLSKGGGKSLGRSLGVSARSVIDVLRNGALAQELNHGCAAGSLKDTGSVHFGGVVKVR